MSKQMTYSMHTWFPVMWMTSICFLVQWQSVQFRGDLWVPLLPASWPSNLATSGKVTQSFASTQNTAWSDLRNVSCHSSLSFCILLILILILTYDIDIDTDIWYWYWYWYMILILILILIFYLHSMNPQ